MSGGKRERDEWLGTHAGGGLTIANASGRLLRAVRTLGMAETLRLAATLPFRRVASRIGYRIDGRIDRLYGTDTQGRIPLAALAFDSANKALGRPYEPTPERTFHQIMARLEAPLAGFTFIDYGCGKGRTLLYAASYDFARIVGVEFAPPLAAIASANARRSPPGPATGGCDPVACGCNPLRAAGDAARLLFLYAIRYRSAVHRGSTTAWRVLARGAAEDIYVMPATHGAGPRCSPLRLS